ncbi:uncharacterized protein LOC131888706 [Tigriopus californicus]|nr:uncharacterized protein LOC131888706 [Tigriopus californicus]XP_059093609.1 uncharacterized protein LOC131888706 [Tigriopus californicus]
MVRKPEAKLIILVSVFGSCMQAPPKPLHPNNDGGVFPSFRYNNNRNFWLEYSTPPSTTFPEYDEYYELRSTTPDPRPFFLNGDLTNNSVVEIPLGGTVFLDCQVAQFTSEFEVSWFRRENSNLHVLTIGHDTFSADDRYSLSFEKPLNWRLKIRPTLPRDNGTYVCQVSRHPPIILFTHVKIIVPRVHLVDEDRQEISEKHYKPGSTIELHCRVENFLPQFQDVIWRHQGEVITQGSDRGGISIKTKENNDTLSSHLYLATADAQDSGVYSCSVANLATAQLSLHILNGEEPAAIQSSRSVSIHHSMFQSPSTSIWNPGRLLALPLILSEIHPLVPLKTMPRMTDVACSLILSLQVHRFLLVIR